MAKAKAVKSDKVKKVAAKGKKAAKKVVQEVAETTKRVSIVDDQQFQDQVVGLREQGMKWHEIATETGVSAGRVQLAYLKASGGTEEATPKAVVAARSKELLSWGAIMARFGITEGKARALFAEGGGDADLTINRGGRRASGSAPAPKAAKAAKADKAAAPKKARGKKGKFVITPEMDDAAIVSAVDGRKVTWVGARTGTEATAKIKPGSAAIKAGKGDKRILTFSDGSKARSVDIATIQKIA